MSATHPIFTPSKGCYIAVTLLLQFDFCKISRFSGIRLSWMGSSCGSTFGKNGLFRAISMFCHFLADLHFYCYIFLLKSIKHKLYKGLSCCNSKWPCAKKRKFKGVLLQTVTPLLQKHM